MTAFGMRTFYSLEHDYPIIELYGDDVLIAEIVTTAPGSVEVVPNSALANNKVSIYDLSNILGKVMTTWYTEILNSRREED